MGQQVPLKGISCIHQRHPEFRHDFLNKRRRNTEAYITYPKIASGKDLLTSKPARQVTHIRGCQINQMSIPENNTKIS